MSTIEEQIELMGIKLVTNGIGFNDSFTDALKKTYTNSQLSFSLESTDGVLLSIGSLSQSNPDPEKRALTIPVLDDATGNNKSFLFSTTDTRWNLLTVFKTGNFPWFTNTSLDISGDSSLPVRSGIFKIADHFTIHCKRIIEQFIKSLSSEPGREELSLENHFLFEQFILQKMVTFSSRVTCVMLLDEDGYVIYSTGMSGAVKELGSALAVLFNRSTIELSRLESTACTSIDISDHEYTIKLVKITGTTLIMAISVSGNNTEVLTGFLEAIGVDAFAKHLSKTGMLCGIPFTPQPALLRKRVSWLNSPSIVAMGAFAGKKGAATFHTPDCHILQTTDIRLLEWYKNRTEAIEKKLRPCSVCNP